MLTTCAEIEMTQGRNRNLWGPVHVMMVIAGIALLFLHCIAVVSLLTNHDLGFHTLFCEFR